MPVQTLFENLSVDGVRDHAEKFDAAFSAASGAKHVTADQVFQTALNKIAEHSESAARLDPRHVRDVIGIVLDGEFLERYSIAANIRQTLVTQETALATQLGQARPDRSVVRAQTPIR